MKDPRSRLWIVHPLVLLSRGAVARLSTVIFILALVGSCSAETDPDQPGTCNLSCKSPKVGGVNYTIAPLATAGIEYTCTGNKGEVREFGGPVQIRYRVYEERTPFPPLKAQSVGEAGPADAQADPQAGQGGQGTAPVEEAVQIPRGGIGFEPWIFGSASGNRTNPEHVDGQTITPYKFAGVVTPKEEWCSDSCGVMTYEVWPLCFVGYEVGLTAGIASGGTPVSDFLSITIKGEALDAN
jgi:hypothetical protein